MGLWVKLHKQEDTQKPCKGLSVTQVLGGKAVTEGEWELAGQPKESKSQGSVKDSISKGKEKAM